MPFPTMTWILTVLSLLLICGTVSSSNNASTFNNFTIEWRNISMFTCLAPQTIKLSSFKCINSQSINISSFSCATPNYTKIDYLSCFNVSTIGFSEGICYPTTTTTTTTAHSSISTSTTHSTSTSVASPHQSASTSTTQSTSTTAASIHQSTSTSTTQSTSTTTASIHPSTTISTTQSTQTNVVSTALSTIGSTAIQSTLIAIVTNQLSTRASTPTAITTTAANPYICTGGNLGIYCNISSNACEMAQPCLNAATCFPNNTLPLGYECLCHTGYTGEDCQNDDRVCKENTCWNNGTCVEVNTTISGQNSLTFQCYCETGYTGTNCELIINYCQNITCENNAVCQTVNFTWKCICVDSKLYYGDLCQFQTNVLQLKKILTKSFGSIAITAIALTCSFILLMDILKYGFHIDPVETERRRLRRRQLRRSKPRPKQTKVALRFQYIA